MKQSAIDRLNAQNDNSNYTFLNGTDVEATYTINQRTAQVTLVGTQKDAFTQNKVLDLSKYEVQLTNTADGNPITITNLQSGDLLIKKVGGGTYAANEKPTDVGIYDVEMTAQLINRLKQEYPNYNFDEVDDDGNSNATVALFSTEDSSVTNSDASNVSATNENGKYIIYAIDATIDLRGGQTVKYRPSGYTGSDITTGNYTVTLTDAFSNVIGDFTLGAGDLTFTEDPSHVGQYTVKLSADALSRIEEIGANNSMGNDNYQWVTDYTNTAEFTVEAMPVTIAVGNQDNNNPQISIYGQPIHLDNGKYTITLTTEDGTPLTYTLQDGDLDFTNGTPTTVGTFDVQLSSTGLQHIKDYFNNAGYENYDFAKPTSTATYKVTAATPTITITANGTSQKTYDVRPATIQSGDFTITITTDNGQTIAYPLSSDDLQFVGATPINVGSYDVQLKPSTISNLKQQFPNYDWDSATVTGAVGKYTITAAQGSAVLSGAVSKTFDGTAISDLSPIKVTVNYPGVGTGTTYVLQNGDYVIVDDATGTQYTPDNAPAAKGNYHIELTAAGKANIAQLGNGSYQNIKWDDSSYTGSATYVITAANVTPTLSGTNSKTYNGSSTTLAEVTKDGHIKVSFGTDSQGLTIPDYALQTGDFDWFDANGNSVAAPTNAGTYTIKLNQTGIQHIQDYLNQKYGEGNVDSNTTDTGKADFTIDPFAVTVTINGSVTVDSGTTTIPDGEYSFSFAGTNSSQMPTGWTAPTIETAQLSFDGEAPTADTENGTFTVNYNGGQAALQQLLGSNYQVNYVAGKDNYIVAAQDHTVTIKFVDDDDNGAQVGDLITKNGKTGQSIVLGLNVPTNYSLASGQTLPTDYKFTSAKDQTITIHLVHATKTVDGNDPDTIPSGVDQDQLIHTATRTINDNLPSGTVTKTQTATITRSATYDEVTHELSNFSDWTTASWDGYTPTVPAGYTADPSSIASQAITDKTTDTTVDINYTAVPQPGQQVIQYIDTDENDKVIGTQAVRGEEGSTVDFTANIPANYEVVGTLPTSVTINGGTTQILLKHKTSPVTDSKTITRTIIEHLPNGDQTQTQTVTLDFTGTKDLVTNQTTGTWTTGSFGSVNVTVTEGYTASQTVVPEMTVTSETKNSTVEITYTQVPKPAED